MSATGHAAAAAGKPHAARKLVDIAQKARGRTPLKYELEVIPYLAGELPSGLEKVSFAWERGDKVFTTDAVPVNPHTRAAFWSQYLRQTATLYRENGRLQPKEYSFKVQHVRGTGSSATRKTVGKVKVDMSQFCTEGTTAVPQEVFLQLKPACKLKVSVRATWLKDAKVDMDALTELSFSTHRSGGELGGLDGDDEQDLSGFDPVDMHEPPQHLGYHRTGSSGSGGGTAGQQHSSSSPRSTAAGGTSNGGGRLSKMAAANGTGGSSLLAAAPGSPRIPAVGVHAKPGIIPAFAVPLSPEEQRAALEQEKARLAAFQQAELVRMRATIEQQLRGEMSNALAAHNNSSWWRDCLCCCFPRHEVRMRTTAELALRGESGNKFVNVQPGYEL